MQEQESVTVIIPAGTRIVGELLALASDQQRLDIQGDVTFKSIQGERWESIP